MAALLLKMKIVGVVNVPSAGVPVQLSPASVLCSTIVFQADPANTDAIVVGDASVSSAGKRGFSLTAGQAWSISGDQAGTPQGGQFDLSDYWADVATSNDKVRVFASSPRGN